MEKFQNKYRIPSARLQTWDYGSNSDYFITICTKNREHFFGEIIDEQMSLNNIGILADQFWKEIPNHFSFIALGEFTIMPNHIHGILTIEKTDFNETVETLQCNVSEKENSDETLQCNLSENNNMVETLQCNVSTKNEMMSNISPKSQTISSIIRSYKSIVSKESHLINPVFAWQPRFHDHIIRNHKSYLRIEHYIATNPQNWNKDKFYYKIDLAK